MPLIYLYSHDGDGLGHLRRNLNIARAITKGIPQSRTVLLTGSLLPGAFGLPERCDFIKIPSVKKVAPSEYVPHLSRGSEKMVRDLRVSILEAAMKRVPPDLLIVDRHPQGLQGELLPALRWLKRNSPRTRLVLGLRDVLDEPAQIEREWRADGTLDVFREMYDRIWLYTDDSVYPTADAYDFAPELRARTS